MRSFVEFFFFANLHPLLRHILTEEQVAIKVIDKVKLDEISKQHLYKEVITFLTRPVNFVFEALIYACL